MGESWKLGIAAGGSTALLAMLTTPSKLVALEYADRVAALDAFIEARGLGDQVRPCYGVDQGDRETVAAIIDREFDGPLDLVIDDTSHLWDKTRASFEVLFPRLRPGGRFIIEDWAAHYVVARRLAETSERNGLPDNATPRSPLARMGVELMLASSSAPTVIAEVTINQHWVSVCRGDAPIDATTFRVSDLYSDAFRWLDGDEHWFATALTHSSRTQPVTDEENC